jgi:hypothetical protein
MLNSSALDRFKKKLNHEKNKQVTKVTMARIIFSTSIGGLSAYYSFSETAMLGAKLIPFPNDLALKQSLAEAGGPLLNGILNAYFTDSVLASTSPAIILNNKAKYAITITFGGIGAGPYISNIIRANHGNHEWFKVFIVALAYTIQNLKGAENIINRLGCEKLCEKRHDHSHYTELDNIEKMKDDIIEKVTLAIKKIKYSFIHTKKLALSLESELSHYDKIKSATAVADENLSVIQFEELPPNKKRPILCSYWLITSLGMACAVMGYAQMTANISDDFLGIDHNSKLAPLGFLSFLPFTGLLLLVIASVGQSLVELTKRGSLPFYMQNQAVKLLAVIGNSLLITLGIYSTATCLFLNDKYFGHKDWYETLVLPITILALYATTLFNSFPAIDIFNNFITKKIARLIDSNINKIADLEDTAQKFIAVVKKTEEPSVIEALIKELNSKSALPDIESNERKETTPEKIKQGMGF